MGFRWKNDLTPADVTPEHMWMKRRHIIASLAAGAIMAPGMAQAQSEEDALGSKYIRRYNQLQQFLRIWHRQR